MDQTIGDAAERRRLNARIDALLAVRRASRDEKFLAQLKARAGIDDMVDKSVLLALIYWHLVERPL